MTEEWHDGYYFGIPVNVKLIGDEGIEIIGKNKFYDWLVWLMTGFENGLNFICSMLFENYEPYFKVWIKEKDHDET